MLLELNISNFALIDNSSINFEEGLSVLVGETGSGKSIIIDALSIALGARANKDKIKSGAEKAVVQAVFDITDNDNVKNILNDNGLPVNDNLLINREINSNSGNISRINGIVSNLTVLNSITSHLIDIFGQFEHQSLTDSNYQRKLVDSFGDDEFHSRLNDFGNSFRELTSLKKRYDELNINEALIEREIDILKYQINEIEVAELDKYDEESSLEELNRLQNMNVLREELGSIEESIDSSEYHTGIIELISKQIKSSQNIDRYDNSNVKLTERLNSVFYELEDIYSEFRNYSETLYFDDEVYNIILGKVDTVSSLKKKYGNSISEILKFYDDALLKIEEYNNHDKKLAELESRIVQLNNRIASESEYISKKRITYSIDLEKNLIGELNELNMPYAKFKVDIKPTKTSSSGSDEITFLISTNQGEDLKELSQISSGGEISRIMLAFKNLLANLDEIDTLIFDEIDTGISGNTAKIVGNKIKNISGDRQVICISHLPQIISTADNCYLIYKELIEGKTSSNVRKLSDSEFIEQLATIIDGDNYNIEAYNTAKKMIAENR
ncbi:MAG: DNA repair protein RecN [Tissierellia bacterium]|nr:DNA repair protein RecN [Tissierellia bacterium]